MPMNTSLVRQWVEEAGTPWLMADVDPLLKAGSPLYYLASVGLVLRHKPVTDPKQRVTDILAGRVSREIEHVRSLPDSLLERSQQLCEAAISLLETDILRLTEAALQGEANWRGAYWDMLAEREYLSGAGLVLREVGRVDDVLQALTHADREGWTSVRTVPRLNTTNAPAVLRHAAELEPDVWWVHPVKFHREAV